MRLPTSWSTGTRLLAVLLLSTTSCVCVDASKLTAFKCSEGAECPAGLTCCDDVCRASCSPGAGGGGAGGGMAMGEGDAGPDAGPADGGCEDNRACANNPGAPCRTGVTSCQTGQPTCIDGAAAPNGLGCGNDLICRSGVCVACVAGTSCTSNPNPCVEGETTCGATPGCNDTTRARPPGASCGTGRVCTTSGACITCEEGARCSGNPSAPCISGVVRCESGTAVCVDGPPAPSGVACGVDRVCVGGNCLQCTSGQACQSNPGAPCRRGVTTCGAMPTCDDGANASAGTPCGTNQVCDPAGTCVACAQGAACTTNPDPCRRGVIQCASGAPVCTDDALKPAGAPCGTNQVCTATGTCLACVAGMGCATNPNSACFTGVTSCSTGALACVDAMPKAAGTACGTNQVCDGSGSCGMCTPGASCTTNPGAPCRLGTVDCSSGVTRCVDSTNVAGGTPCGPDRVCNGMGSCTSCVAGASCTTNPNPGCRTGITSCATGTQTCIDSGNRPPGTGCGTNQVCNTNGNCLTCVSNQACTSNPNPGCRNGITSCTTGTQTCIDGSNRAAGTSCGSGQVCDATGNCGACMAGAACSTNPGAPCRNGRVDCSTGSTVCVDATTNASAGTSCGAGQVCNGSGSCVACAAGNVCGTNPNLCRNGITDCSSGALACIDGSNKAPGSVCGTNQVCNSAAACVNCTGGASCTPTNPCFTGSISCTSGAPVCMPGTRRGTGASCGTNLVCNASDQCVMCTQGASCTSNPGSACVNGITDCASGAAVCTNGSNKPNGTACAGGVCNNGSCTPCNAGAACTTNPNSACRNGIISCSSGTAQCVDDSNKANGTACSGGVCNAGTCTACNAGAACTTNPGSACRNGIIDCSSGSAQCVDGSNKTNGTTCSGGVCSNGFCSACTQGAGCTSNPNAACRNGSIDCGSGMPVCVDASNKSNGTTCSGGVCLNGSCNACSAGASCTTNSNSACQNGFIDCSSGSGVCANGSNKANGTGCPGGVCLSGSCNPCTSGAGCTPANPCKTGTTSCSTGSPVCSESGNVANGTACPGGVCSNGSCVACAAGSPCGSNPNANCSAGVISCTTGSPVCVDSTPLMNGTMCASSVGAPGRCAGGVCCFGCIDSGGVCRGGFSNSACGVSGTNCRICSSGRLCDEGVCVLNCPLCIRPP